MSLQVRGGSRGVAKFLSESNTFHIKSKAIKMLSCKSIATLLDPPLQVAIKSKDKKVKRLENIKNAL